MNHLINFNQYQYQQERRQKERQREQEQRQREQEQYRQQQQHQWQEPQHRNYFLPSMNHLITNQPPVQNRENYEPNMGHFDSPSGHVREQGMSFGSLPNQSTSRWPIEKFNGWFEPTFSRESRDSSPERRATVVDNPIALRNRPTERRTWRSFNAESPDFSPERQNEVVDRNRSTTGGANGNSSKSERGIWRKRAGKNKSVGSGYIGFKPEPKRRRTMEPTKPDNRERLEPIKSWAQLAQEARERLKPNSVSASAQARDALKTKNQQMTDLGQPRKRSSQGKIMTLPLWRRKWYLRYIAQGFSTEEAMSMSWEPVQPATAFNANKSKETTTSGKQQQQSTSTADATNLSAATTGENVDKETEQEPDEKLKICLKPVGYPEKKLNHKEKIQLEEAIIEEVRLSRGVGRLQLLPPLRFTSNHFRLGYIEVCCFNQETAKWLLNCGSKLSTYKGPAVEVLQESKPDKLVHSISLFLPRSAGKPDGYIRELLKAQNALNIEMWQITQRKDQGTGCVIRFDIDDESAKGIAANDHKVFYRLSTVAVTGLEKLDKPIAASVNQISSPGDEAPKRAELTLSVPIPIQEKVLFTIDLASDNEENEPSLPSGRPSVKKCSAQTRTATKNVRPEIVASTEVIILEDKIVEDESNSAKADEENIVEKQNNESKIIDKHEQNLATGKPSVVKKRAAQTKTAAKNVRPEMVAASEVIILEDKVIEDESNSTKADEENIVEKQTEESMSEEMQVEEGGIVDKQTGESKSEEVQVEEAGIEEKQTEESMSEEKQVEEGGIVEQQAEVKVVAESKIIDKPAEERKTEEKQAEGYIVEQQAEVDEKTLEEKDPIEIQQTVAEKESIQEIKEKKLVQEMESIEGGNTLNKENILAKNVEEAKDSSEDRKSLAESESNSIYS